MSDIHEFDIGPSHCRVALGGVVAYLCPCCGAEPNQPRFVNRNAINQAPVWEMTCPVGCVRFTARTKVGAFQKWNIRSMAAAREVIARGR